MNKPHDDQQWPQRITIAGVGLLGGSVALAIRRARPSIHITGVVRDLTKGEQWIQAGILDVATDSLKEACRDCDCVVVATPVDRLAQIVIASAQASPEACLITDVGSTKREIVAAVGKVPTAAKKFVAAHPIAGSEKSGAEHSTASLFDQKTIVITPSEANDEEFLRRASEFWTLTGGRILTMSPDEHDVHLASVSHVPHLLSALVAKMVEGPAQELVGSGWQDITRVAAGDPEMWTAICAANRVAIIRELDRYITEASELREIIESAADDALQTWLTKAKNAKEQSRELR
ncbi:prephenate dehydrogenase [Rubripirellula amarantea]|uniref:Prephenate dehydrogenase n=1 Tax=Rubripirellula amarantea TaxID=2527999 RepID=A0A5C5WSF3_9BACT|nr:prephenate dehydrogenase/arogenate dehydrogenase family protein [Rubripirellula amarantea]TWT53547.1 prephenate dehydrogenase [Rubripirellula amarantea]